jgi:hypothetical protein
MTYFLKQKIHRRKIRKITNRFPAHVGIPCQYPGIFGVLLPNNDRVSAALFLLILHPSEHHPAKIPVLCTQNQ